MAIQDLAHAPALLQQITRIQPDAAKPSTRFARQLRGCLSAGQWIVGVNQQDGSVRESLEQGLEALAFRRESLSEGMRCRARERDAIQVSGEHVRRAGATADVSRSSRAHACLGTLCPAGAELPNLASGRGMHYAGRL